MASGADQRIKVGIRVRKLTRKEKDRNKQLQWKYSDNQVWQIDPLSGKKTGNTFTFDYVFGMDSSSQNIFDDLVKPIVESSVKGFNGTIFAYGQTSSGKTYTMLGEKSEGIIPLSVNHVFSTAEESSDRDYLIRVSYMEIYNEKIYDLLEGQSNLKIHEDSSGTAYVILKEEIVDCPEKVLAAMKKGEKMRRFGVTDINERSSRSHTIFRITIESRKQQSADKSTNENYWDIAHVSHLNLIDLAGSERVFQTKATGDRFKEGCAINKSLFHLGNVISQLSEGSGQYVNFRDSKLTRILASSLGGNALTAIICTVTPASVEETASTLSFASRAIRVTNTPHLNEIVSDECLIRRHAALVKKLEMELEKAKKDNDRESMKKELEQKENIICRLKDWIRRDELQVYSPRLVSRSERRKTWAANDLAASLERAKSFQPEGINELNEEEISCGYMEESSPSFEGDTCKNEKIADFGHRGRSSSGLWNKENHPLQQARLSWHTPLIKSRGMEPKRGSHGGGKKRKSAMVDISCTEDLSLKLIEKEQRIKSLESLVEKLNLKLDGTMEEKKKIISNKQPSQLTEVSLADGNSSCNNVSSGTFEIVHNLLPSAEEAALQLKVESLVASLEKEKSKVETLEVNLEKEKLKVESLESSLEKQAKEMEELALKEEEILSKMKENDALALSEKKASLNEIEIMLGENKEANALEIDLLFQVKHYKEYASNLEKKVQENDVMIHSLSLTQDELNSALTLSKLHSNEANAKLKEMLASISNLSRELATPIKKSGDMEVEVDNETTFVECQDDENVRPKDVIQHLTEVIEGLRSFFIKEILELSKQAEGLSVATAKMDEEILSLKIHFENLLMESDELKAERNEFESILNKEKEIVNSLQTQLQFSNENRVCLSQQVNELLERNAEMQLTGMTENRMETETDLLTSMTRINELEEDLQASEIVIANLAESDEDNLVELREMTKQQTKLKEELVDAHENMKSLLAEINNIRENSVPMESMDMMKSDVQRLSSECESYQRQFNEVKEAYVELEEKNCQVWEEMRLLIEENNRVIAESEEVRSANSRGYNELMLVQEALQEAKCELSNLAEEKEILTLSFATEKNKNDLMQSNVDKVVQENESLLKELEKLRQTCDRESDQSEVISSLHKELEQVKFSLSVCTESEKELDNLLTLEKKKIDSLNHQLSKKVLEYEDMMLQCEKFQHSVVQLECTIKLSEEENIALANNISQLRILNEEQEKNINVLKVKLSDVEQSCISKENELKSQIEKMIIELGEKTNEINQLSASNSEICLLLDSKGETICELESNILKLREELHFYIKEVNEGNVKISELQADLIATQDRICKETSQVREKSEELMKEKLDEMTSVLEMTEEKLKINSEEAAAKNEELKEIISSLRKELIENNSETELILKEKDEKMSSLEHELQIEIENLKGKVQETESLLSNKSDVEAKLEEVSAEKNKLCIELETAEERMQNMKNDIAAEIVNEKSNYEKNIANLQKQLQDTSEEFEVILKEKDEKMSSLEHELQVEIENLKVKVQEAESLLSNKSDVEAKLEEVSAEKNKLCIELEMAEERMQNMKNDIAAEIVNEKSDYEKNIANLQKQLQDTSEEFEVILKEKDEKMTSLEHELQIEIENLKVKVQETESLLSNKNDVEAKLEEVSAEKNKLCIELETAEERMQNMKNDIAAEIVNEKTNYEKNIANLQKQLQDTSDEFEVILKEKDEKMSSLEHELQIEIENLKGKVQETESLLSNKSDVEAKLEEVSAEKNKLCIELEMAEERMQNMKNDIAAEIVNEKSDYEKNIANLQKQLQDTSEEFEVILKEKDEKMSSLEHELQIEIENLKVKVQETESLLSNKSDVEAKFEEVSAEKNKLFIELEMAEERMQNMKNDIAAEIVNEKSNYEKNIANLQKQLQDTSEEFEVILKEKDEKMISLEHELQIEIENLKVKFQETESLLSNKNDVEARLEEVSAEKNKLCIELEMAEERMQNMKNDIAAEIINEKSDYEKNIANLQKQLQDTSEEFEVILKEKDEKMTSLEHELQIEIENLKVKVQETESLLSNKSDVEAKLEEVSAEKNKLCIELETAEERMQNMKNDIAAEIVNEKSNYEKNIANLQKQLQDTSEEFEVILKEKDEKMSSLEHELQIEIENLKVKVQETESLLSNKSDVEVKLEEVSAEKNKLCIELEMAEERMQNMKNDIAAEIVNEKSNYEKNIANLQKQLQDTSEKFNLILKEKDDKMHILENDIISGTQKYDDKERECKHMEFLKKQLESQIEQFSLEEQKYLATERKLAAEEIKSEMLEKRLEELNISYAASVEELSKLKYHEHVLCSDLEKIKTQCCEFEKAHELTRKDLSLARSNYEKLQSEVGELKGRVQEETNMKQQLSIQLSMEQEGHLAARASEEKILGVLSAQEKVMSVFETTISDLKEKLNLKSENVSDLTKRFKDLESKLTESESLAKAELFNLRQEKEKLEEELNGLILNHKPIEEMKNVLQEKDQQLIELKQKMIEEMKERQGLEVEVAKSQEEGKNLETHLNRIQGELDSLHDAVNKKQEELSELQEKYGERDDYAKRMDQWVNKMEKRVSIAEDYRLEVQQKARTMEAELRLKINQLKTEKEKLECRAMEVEPAKCNCLQYEKDLKQEKEEKETLKLKVDEYNKIIGSEGRCESIHSERPKMSDSAVQTTSVEVVDIDPNGCGVVQLCKVDVLNQTINKLRKDKEDLKQICRRRHNQREELKLQTEELKIKIQTLESQIRKG